MKGITGITGKLDSNNPDICHLVTEICRVVNGASLANVFCALDSVLLVVKEQLEEEGIYLERVQPSQSGNSELQ